MNGGWILLVEDNADDVALTLRAFAKNGMADRIVVAPDGEAALGRLRGCDSDRPAVVLLDLNLPRIDGLEVLRRMRADERCRVVPVVVLTSSRDQRDLDEAYRRGANSYIRKPIAFADFVDTARHLGLYWLVLNELPEPGP